MVEHIPILFFYVVVVRPSRIFEILNLGCNVAHCDENLGHCILGRLKTNVPPTKILKKLWQDQQMAKSVLKRVEMIGNYLPLFATYYENQLQLYYIV